MDQVNSGDETTASLQSRPRDPPSPVLPPREELLVSLRNDDEAVVHLTHFTELTEIGCGAREAQRFIDAVKSGAQGTSDMAIVMKATSRTFKKMLVGRDQQVQQAVTTAE